MNEPVILVEDDEDDIFLIRMALEELQIPNQVVVFRNGLDAFEYLKDQHEKPYVVISDLNMPVMNGFELLSSILDHDVFSGAVPAFVFLTTSDLTTIPPHSFDQQSFSFFTKGYSYEQILETMKIIIDYGRSKKTEGR
ncbi:Response regulator receiver domain-containing protein [Dyadobacter soli]|uniref:Response regulator receiver domain-containing protein n=1 Tax=Dyadobacter soli TaxID=659014 RepID=A0A1G7SDQ3_9BACT|nr:response regulator [Dyadobacter soli]SDG21205.1 Response regulator receiver domain-containing protein [Dyadobacter soli]